MDITAVAIMPPTIMPKARTSTIIASSDDNLKLPRLSIGIRRRIFSISTAKGKVLFEKFMS